MATGGIETFITFGIYLLFLTKDSKKSLDFYKWEMNCFFCKKIEKGYAYDTIFV